MKINNLITRAILLFFMLAFALSAQAGAFSLKYEQVIKDSYGNEVGYKTSVITNINQLPANSPWRDYLNIKLPNGKTIYQYATSISSSLNNDFTMIISDRDQNSYSCKTKNGYQINIYDYVNNYASNSSKAFLFLHEFGHTTMLNSYPASYDFRNLDYGADGVHYLDEILPNHNTSWVEGWANAFAAHNNNGKIFSIDINSNSSMAFLSGKTFDERARNELFVSKILFDMIRALPNGQSCVYDVFAKTGPHSSLYEFCNKYVQLYPEHQGLLAQIIMSVTLNEASLDDILAYINGGSRTVSASLYASLQSMGLVNSQGKQVASNNKTNTTSTASTGQKQSVFGKLFSWIGRLFGFSDTNGALATSVDSMYNNSTSGVINSVDKNIDLNGGMAIKGSITATGTATGNNASENIISEEKIDLSNYDSDSFLELQEKYYKTFAEYNDLMITGSNTDKSRIKQVNEKMLSLKKKLKELEKSR
jgi:hypothetical protein